MIATLARRVSGRTLAYAFLLFLIVSAIVLIPSLVAHAAPLEPVDPSTDPTTGTGAADLGTTSSDQGNVTGTEGVNINLGAVEGGPSSAVLTLLAVTVLSVAPALLLMMSSFTKIFIVLAMTRNALSLPSIPPNQVLAGLAMFLSLFIMGPVLTEMFNTGVQPYLDGQIDFQKALEIGVKPLQEFMLAHTREEDIALILRAADQPNPANAADVELFTLIPAFMLSELRAAFIIGFVIFIPFLVIDIVVSAALMSLGMMMLPPPVISLPFKILLFILVDGWGLVIDALIKSYGS